MRRSLTIILATVVLILATTSLADAQKSQARPPTSQAGHKQPAVPEASPASTKAQQELSAASKKAIIETGISEPYFDQHFRLTKVFNEASDRRVEWKYSINGYETTLIDDVGYYTSQAGERVDVHSIKNELYAAYDIKTTIPRDRADAALKSCLGEHSETMIVYRALKAPGKAGLYLTARSIEKQDEEKREEEEREGEREIEGLTFNVGFVNLENGKCIIQPGKVTP